MTYNSAHTGPEIDAAVQLLGDIQSAKDATAADRQAVSGMAATVASQASQVGSQAASVSSNTAVVLASASAVEADRAEVEQNTDLALSAKTSAEEAEAVAVSAKEAVEAIQLAVSQSQVAINLSEQNAGDSASSARTDREIVETLAQQVGQDSASSAASAASAAAVVTGGTATLLPEPGKIPLAKGDGKIDAEWLPEEIARLSAVEAVSEMADTAIGAAEVAEARTAGFLSPSAEPPVLRDNGLPLQVGDRYFNTQQQSEYIFTDDGWEANDSQQAIQDLNSQISAQSGDSLIPRALPTGKLDMGWMPTELTTLALRLAGVYTPQMFGVTNDGVTNYTTQIRNLHNAANLAANARVDYHGISTLCIDAGAFITINTDVDWAGCKLKLLNGFDPNPDFQTSTVFFVDDPDIVSQTITIDSAELFKGATRFTVPESIGNGFLLVQSNKPVGNRTSEPSVDLFYEQPFSIERGGILNKPLGTDLTTYTVTATFRRNPSRWIDLRGLVADESTFNNQCLVKVRRNLVRQFGYIIQPSGINTQPKNVNYLFQSTYCSNVVCEDWQVSAQTSDGGVTSTYGITADRVAELFYNRITGKGRNTWGVTLTDFVNGWYINDCHLNRIDVHKGMHNTYVRGGSLYDLGVRYGWGTGSLLVEGVTVYGNTSVAAARTDYDGGWDGDIRLIDNIQKFGKLVAASSGVAEVSPIFSCSALGGRAPVKMCESLEILNPTFDYEGPPGILLVRPIVSDVVSGHTECDP